MPITARRLFVLVLFISIFTVSTREIGDPDFWWHLRTGQYIVESRTVPHSDIFSSTDPGREWVAHEWLAEVLIFGLYRLGGPGLLIAVFAGLITLTAWLIYIRCRGQPYWAGFALLLGALATAPIWGVRPQILTFLLGALYLVIIEGYVRNGRTKSLLPLPFLMALWVNLHSGYILGLAILAIYTGGEMTDVVLRWIMGNTDSAATRENFARAKTLGVFLAASTVAVILNPNGLRMFSYPFETLTSQAMQAYIQEWFSPDFHLAEWQPFAALLIVTLATALLVPIARPAAPILLAALFGYAALRSVRNIPFFVLAAVPLLSAQIDGIFARWKYETHDAAPKFMRFVNGLIVVLCLAVAMIHLAAVVIDQPAYEAKTFPAAAVAWIEENSPPGVIYNTYDWGGYLLWKLFPEHKVYIDGRADVYGDAFIREYLSIYRADPGWETKLRQAGVHTILISPTAPLAAALADTPAWSKSFQDSLSVVYTLP